MSKPLACWICGKVVDLSKCKIDEQGLAVHEACYVTILKSKPERPPTASEGPQAAG